MIERDLIAAQRGSGRPDPMAADANPATSRSLALALSAELLGDAPSGRVAATYRPRRRRDERTSTPPSPPPAPPVGGAHTAHSTRRGPCEAPPVIMLPAPGEAEPANDALRPAERVVIAMPGERAAGTALVPLAPPERARVIDGDKADLLKCLRRTWMSAPFKSVPHCLLVARIRPALPSARAARDGLAHPSMVRIVHALGEIGPVFATGPDTVAILLARITLHQALRIAAAVGKAVDQRTDDGQGEAMLFSCGVAAMYRDDDPVSVTLLAEQCLAMACRRDESAVVGENDPAIRNARLR